MDSGASACVQLSPLEMTATGVGEERSYNAGFAMYVANEEEQGRYNLFFHNCPNYDNGKVSVNFTVKF